MYEKRSAANMLRAVGMHPKYKGYAYVLCILEKTGMGLGKCTGWWRKNSA